jgi:catalase
VEEDYYEQPGILYRKMSPAQQLALFENTARAISGASEEVMIRHIKNCRRADPAYGEGVARALRIEAVA